MIINKLTAACFIGLTFLTCALNAQTQKSTYKQKKSSKLNYRLYSETSYDARLEGLVNDSSLHLTYNYKNVEPYIGLQVTKELARQGQNLLAEDSVAPKLGVRWKAFSFLGLFAESRFNILSNLQNNSNLTPSEFRYGLYAYDFQNITAFVFNEVYSELVTVDRVSQKPVFVIWNKLGYRVNFNSKFRSDLYSEVFSRQSPNPNYGPIENEFRLGTRFTYYSGYWSSSLLLYNSTLSNLKQGSTSFLFTLSREVF